MKTSLLIAAGVLLAGCVSPSAMLVNRQGQTMRCATTGGGYGIAGAIAIQAAQKSYDACVSDYQRIGFVKLPDTTLGAYGEWNKSYVVTKVFGPAEAVGIKAGDEIVAIDGKPVDSVYGAYQAVEGKSAGDKVKVVVRRENQEMTFEPTLAARGK